VTGERVEMPDALRHRFAPEPSENALSAHRIVAEEHARRDGAASIYQVPAERAVDWLEKVHHLGAVDEIQIAKDGQGVEVQRWENIELPSPEFFWDRARFLSKVRRDFRGAAEVYQECVRRFPGDDYGWHYGAWNSDRVVSLSHQSKTSKLASEKQLISMR
jgi:hypothetical protein